MKILVRSGTSPLMNFTPGQLIARNAFGGNLGNLAYQFGVYRTLINKETELLPDYYGVDRGRITLKDAEMINKKYSAYICPMANGFREGFINHLIKYTSFIENLEIPFVVAGIGVSTDIKSDGYENFPFDEHVTNFINAIRDNGTIIGVRGRITGNYLSNLGFKEKKDFMVIGCPAMFSFGNHLKIRDKKITKESLISINSGLYSSKINNFIFKTMQEFSNYYFIPQWRSELRLTYIGRPNLKQKSEVYPVDLESPAYKNNRVRAPINVQGWIDFLKKIDLSFGARLHGNIMATIAGTPSIMIVKDGRMRELADFHRLTNITENELIEFDSVLDIIENVDFNSPEKGHTDRFNNYLKFWKKNKIKTAYDEDFNLKKLPIDDLLRKNSSLPIETTSKLKKEEVKERVKEFKIAKNSWKVEINENNEIKNLLSQNNIYNKLLNYFKFN